MIYLGSKKGCMSNIIPVLQKTIDEGRIENFYEIMCGSAEISTNIRCNKIFANDICPTLIELHQQAQDDFSMIPTKGTSKEEWEKSKKEYKKIKEMQKNGIYDMNKYKEVCNKPLYQIGVDQFYSSYFSGGFVKGYNPLQFKLAYKNHQKQSESNNYKNINFLFGDYSSLNILENSIIYCDPPYEGVSGSSNYDLSFNFFLFLKWVEEQSRKSPIFISYPKKIKGIEGIKECSEYEIKRKITRQKKTYLEYLFLVDNRGK